MAEKRPYKLYSDSTADLSQELLSGMDVSIVKLTFEMNGKNYADGELPMDSFYKSLREGAVSKTAQIAPSTYEEIFEKEIKAGYDILYLGFSSGLSGSYGSSCIARDTLLEKYPEAKIICIDSLCASTGEGLLLYKADEKKRSGMDIDELAKWLEATKLHLCHVFTVDDLKFLRRGGRVSATAAFAGTLLGIKPLLHVDNDGHLIPLGKVRGRKHSLEKLVDMMSERVKGWENPVVMICHGDAIADAQYVEKLVKERLGRQTDVKICYTGTAIGSHSGPGTLALFFMGEER